jgi:penicillin amidase
MKYIKPAVLIIVTIVLVVLLNTKLGQAPPFGKFLDPFHGFWQNAEKVGKFNQADVDLPGLKGKVEVYYDERLVPHVFAENDHDLYYMQGYITAQHRLWQMELQTYAAAGRLAEVTGNPKLINLDREKRRIGMVYGAKKALEKINDEPETKAIMEAYTNGVNSYIKLLSSRELPIEYKLLDIKPEEWTILKTALLLKYMANMLTGDDDDFAITNSYKMFGKETTDILYPVFYDTLQSPIVPSGTKWDFEPEPYDSTGVVSAENFIPAGFKPQEEHDPGTGSNNWAVSGSKTASGKPILCNDPHLGLNLPSIWFEMQLHAPGVNVYGVTLPGSPAVVIGFNDSIAWGVTNGNRDVRDWYAIKFKDQKRDEYWYNNQWVKTTKHIDTIKVRGAETIYDTVVYTHHGPVVYDNSFKGKTGDRIGYALSWTAHIQSNEMVTLHNLNRAKNFNDYREAIKTFACPGQNFVFASVAGDVAITQQGKFVNKWPGQGRYVMDGSVPQTGWSKFIPVEHNPLSYNPPRGFVSSANQHPTDATYPYLYSGFNGFEFYRNRRVNEELERLNKITPKDMMTLQNDNFNVKARDLLPLFLKNLDQAKLSPDEKAIATDLSKWDYFSNPDVTAASAFELWSKAFLDLTWDEFSDTTITLKRPLVFTTYLLALRQPNSVFFDVKKTPEKENAGTIINSAFKAMAGKIADWKKEHGNKPYLWADYKSTSILHLMQLPAFSYYNIHNGGYLNIVNATSERNGPSWRMVVQLGTEPEAYGIYPGGQSGNPGSPFYASMIDKWTKGEYYKLNYYRKAPDKPMYKQTFNPGN